MLKDYTKQELLDALLPVIQMTRSGSKVKAGGLGGAAWMEF